MTISRSQKMVAMSLTSAALITLLTSCSGRTPDGKPCRRNLLKFIPQTTTDMSETCPQDTTYYKAPVQTTPGT
jgi:hypothetical protein